MREKSKQNERTWTEWNKSVPFCANDVYLCGYKLNKYTEEQLNI